ncbi:MAG: alpha-amylase family glycosyl hydrolase [Prolixibacteraceae bacterium]|nr:alpha-amylase family glycosyl hydrolase [Prolixibacteraceae bacterium]
MRTFTLLIVLLMFTKIGVSQIIVSAPALPNDAQSVTITFDATKGTAGLKDYSGDVYAHIGVITDKSTSTGDWKYVVAGWGVNVDKAKMTRVTANSYQITLTPDIRQYFGVPAGEIIQKIALVFRSGVTVNGNYLEGKDTGGKDIFLDVYGTGLNFVIQQPIKNQVYQQYASIPFSASSSSPADLELYLNNKKIIFLTGTSITYNFNIPTGDYWIKAKAITVAKTIVDSVYVHVLGNEVVEPRPAGVKKGINYPDTQSALLVLWAPNKQNVFVMGDFSDWRPSSTSRMKRDGDYFWLKIDNLTPGKEYAFQYLVDGSLKIADPFTDKILDPWNDKYINAATYPNLLTYPTGKTDGIVSVLQPNKTKYIWQMAQFTPPAADTSIIYEALVRDFDTKHTYASVASHLDYLKDLKINVLELMPVNEFEGNSSWGYNPSFYFAADKYYGPADELKKLVDQCHQRGIAVVIDLVLNHSYGQSPFVQLYFDGTNPTAQNPWYNVTSNFENPAAHWGYDFNHNSQATRELVDSIASYWMSEYKVDGFRYDFTKGFSNNFKSNTTDPWGSKYDPQRIFNLERMAGEVRKRKPGALVIFEHLSDNNEEKELVESGNGILLWANSNGNCSEAAMGYNDSGKSDFTWASYTARTWNKAAAVGYMESHDEERIAYKCITFGNTQSGYSIKDSTTAYRRAALTAALFMPIPGPKMIWQFGELGYDYSIDLGGRLGEKPVKWNYVDQPARTYLFRVMAKLFYLKKTFPIFKTTDFSYSLTGDLKWLKLNLNGENVLIAGNFGVASATLNIQFQKAGSWYEYFTDATLDATNTAQSLILAPGEFRLYSTVNFTKPNITTEVDVLPQPVAEFVVWPNPVSEILKISSTSPLSRIVVYTMNGSKIKELNLPGTETSAKELFLGDLLRGNYVIQVISKEGKTESRKIVKY